MKLTADALASHTALYAADWPDHVTAYVEQISRTAPSPPGQGSLSQTPTDGGEGDDSLCRPRSSQLTTDQENIEPPLTAHRGKRRADTDGRSDDDRETRGRRDLLCDRKKRRLERAALTREASQRHSALFEAKPRCELSMQPESEVVRPHDRLERKRVNRSRVLGPLAGRPGATVGQGRLTSRPGFSFAGAASPEVQTGKTALRGREVPDLGFDELDFLIRCAGGSTNRRMTVARLYRSSRHVAKRQEDSDDDAASAPRLRGQLKVAAVSGADGDPERPPLVDYWPLRRTERTEHTSPTVVSREPSATSAMSLLRRRTDPAKRICEATSNRALHQRLAMLSDPQITPSWERSRQSLQRSQSAPLHRSDTPDVLQTCAPGHALTHRGVYDDSDYDPTWSSPRRKFSEQVIAFHLKATNAVSPGQRMFLTNMTPFHPWPVPVATSCGRWQAQETFAIFEDPEAAPFDDLPYLSTLHEMEQPAAEIHEGANGLSPNSFVSASRDDAVTVNPCAEKPCHTIGYDQQPSEPGPALSLRIIDGVRRSPSRLWPPSAPRVHSAHFLPRSLPTRVVCSDADDPVVRRKTRGFCFRHQP